MFKVLARRLYQSAVSAFVLAIGLGFASPVLAADPLTWTGDTLFARDSVREDIKQVLKSALEKSGMSARFEAGVEGRISQNFTNVPPQGVFNMVIENFSLDYSRDAGSGIVTIFPRGADRPDKTVEAPAAETTLAAETTPPVPARSDSARTSATAAEVEKPRVQRAATRQDTGKPAVDTANTTDEKTAGPATPAADRPLGIRRLEWKKVSFERISFEEDIRNIFRAIARANGMQVLFRPDVEGEISFEFRDMDLRAAFRKLIAENGLDFSYDAESNTVTLFKAVSVQRREQLIALQYITAERLRATARRLDLRGEIIVDANNDIVLVKGTVSDVARLADLAEKLDRQEAEKQKQIAEDRAIEALELEAEAKRQEAQAKQRAAQSDASERRAAALQREVEFKAKAEEVAYRMRLKERLLETEVRVIPVRYASVGSTIQSFRGKQVTIPGIDETLRALLGIGGKDGQVAGGGGKDGALLSEVRAELGLTPPQISIDTRTNSIIVRGSKRAANDVEKLVKKLDQRLPLIEIEVIIVNATKGVQASLGVKYGGGGVFKTNEGDQFGGGVNTATNATDRVAPTDSTSTTDALNPVTLLPTVADAGSVANFVFRGANLALQVELDALSRDDKTQIVASPRVITLNNLPAKVTSDDSIFVSTSAGANAAGTLQEINGGLTLDITPSVILNEVSGDDTLIRLSINASRKSPLITGTNATLTGSEIQTQVEIPNGATFMFGGLVDDNRVESKFGVPGLQDIPLIGNLFKSRSSRDELTETIFFITPRLLKSEDLYASDIAQRRYMDTQRARLHDMRQDLQVNSQLLTIQSVTLEEDE